jgi:hypothetical protein
MDLRQFKLTNNEEIICEVVEWNDEETDTIVIRKALRIHAIDDTDVSMRYYTFKPWIMMSTDPDTLHIINSAHIVSESTPAKVALEYFNDVISDLREDETEIELLSRDSDSIEMIEPDSDIVH